MKIYVCECGYRDVRPGKCRSHPYPCRAMGPPMQEVEIIPADSPGVLSPEEARLLLTAILQADDGRPEDRALDPLYDRLSTFAATQTEETE